MKYFLGNVSGVFETGWFSVLTFLYVSMAVEKEVELVYLLGLSSLSFSATAFCVDWTNVLALPYRCALISNGGILLVFMAPKNII